MFVVRELQVCCCVGCFRCFGCFLSVGCDYCGYASVPEERPSRGRAGQQDVLMDVGLFSVQMCNAGLSVRAGPAGTGCQMAALASARRCGRPGSGRVFVCWDGHRVLRGGAKYTCCAPPSGPSDAYAVGRRGMRLAAATTRRAAAEVRPAGLARRASTPRARRVDIVYL